MREKLTQSDVKKIQQEIEHRKLVERKELIEVVNPVGMKMPETGSPWTVGILLTAGFG